MRIMAGGRLEVKGKERETVIESAEMMKQKSGPSNADGELKRYTSLTSAD